MEVKISKAWNNQPVTHIFNRNIFVFLWKLGKNAGADAVFTNYIGVLHENKFVHVFAVTDSTF